VGTAPRPPESSHNAGRWKMLACFISEPTDCP
jgi:hypothetical protein